MPREWIFLLNAIYLTWRSIQNPDSKHNKIKLLTVRSVQAILFQPKLYIFMQCPTKFTHKLLKTSLKSHQHHITTFRFICFGQVYSKLCYSVIATRTAQHQQLWLNVIKLCYCLTNVGAAIYINSKPWMMKSENKLVRGHSDAN